MSFQKLPTVFDMEIFRILAANITKLQQTKKAKIFLFYNFLFFKCQRGLISNTRIIFRKMKKCPLNIRYLYKSL